MIRFFRCAPLARAVFMLTVFQAGGIHAADVKEQPPEGRTMDRVMVIGDRLSATAHGVDAARAEAARVPGGANVVGNDEYAGRRAANLADMFALTPGVFVQPRFGAEEARLSIRGSGLQRTFHLRGIYLLQDGVPLTLADGGGDFQAVEPIALAYTEVLRGANALQYGGTTLGGAVNFVSPSGHDGAGSRSRLEGGGFGYGRLFASFGSPLVPGRGMAADDHLGLSDFFLSGSAYRQDGFRNWSQQENVRLAGNVGWRLTPALESRLFLAAVRSDSQLPGSLTWAQLENDPRAVNAGSLAGRQKRDYDLYRLASRTVLELNGRSLEFTLGYSNKDLWHPIFQALQQQSHDYSTGLRYVDEMTLWGYENRLIVGMTPSWNTLKDDRFVNVAGERGARTGESRQRARNWAAYAENQLQAGTRWTLAAGVQWTQAERRFEDRFLANGDQGFETTYARFSPKLGFLWRAAENVTMFGNVSDSFEPPSFGELSGGPGITQAAAQTARSVELGSRGEAGRFAWDAAVYSAAVRNELLSLNGPGGQPLGTVNAPRTVHRGVEAGLTVRLVSTLSWRSSMLVNDFQFDGHVTYGDNVLPGIPKQLHRGELSWQPYAGYTVTLNGEWTPQRYAIDMANSWFADGYAVWGLRLAYDTGSRLSWFVEGRNLADRRYAATTGVIADAGGQDAAQFLPGDGRSVYAGFEWRPGR